MHWFNFGYLLLFFYILCIMCYLTMVKQSYQCSVFKCNLAAGYPERNALRNFWTNFLDGSGIFGCHWLMSCVDVNVCLPFATCFIRLSFSACCCCTIWRRIKMFDKSPLKQLLDGCTACSVQAHVAGRERPARLTIGAYHVASLRCLSQSTRRRPNFIRIARAQPYPLPAAVARNCFIFVLSFIRDN